MAGLINGLVAKNLSAKKYSQLIEQLKIFDFLLIIFASELKSSYLYIYTMPNGILIINL